jgi:VanZ family protein
MRDGMRRGTQVALSRWLPAVLWGLLILALSTLPELYLGVPKTGTARRLHYYLELVVHVFQFCVFFLLVLRALRSPGRSQVAALGLAFGAVLFLSLTNESVQTLVPTRMFDPSDMAMDAVGGLVGLGLVVVRGPK